MQLRVETTRAADDGGLLVRVGSAVLLLIGFALVGCEGSKESDSAKPPAAESDGSGATDVGVSDSRQDGAGGPTHSDAGTVDAALDATPGPSYDAADSSEVADGGLSDEDSGGGETTDVDGNDSSDAEVGGLDAADTSDEDVHVTVQPPSSGQPCSCWPDGDDCDEFPLLNWPYKERPPCSENEVCSGDNQHPGTCRAKCDQSEPGQKVRLECHPTEKCLTGELFDWEEDIKATDTWCLPK